MADVPPPSTERCAVMTQDDIRAVRQEKMLDSRTRERLEASYGAASTARIGEGNCGSECRLMRAKGWKCPVCQRITYDARRVCGFCLSVEPGVLQNIPVNGIPTASGNGVVVHTRVDPGVSQDPEVRIFSFPQGRCYRISANEPPLSTSEKKIDSGVILASDSLLDEKEGVETEFLHTGCAKNRRERYTHFVTLPIGKIQSVRLSATALLEEMKRCCVGTSTGVTEEIFTTAPRMHFTLLMLSLPTPETIVLAVERMRILQEKVFAWQHADDESDTKRMRPRVRLGGIHAMNRREKRKDGGGKREKMADVLYMGLADAPSTAVVTELQRLVHDCFSEFIMNDPSVAEESKLLHMTLINSKWRLGDTVSDGCKTRVKRQLRMSFDASCLLEHFAHASLSGGEPDGSIALESLELCSLCYDSIRECYPCESIVAL